MSDWNALLEQEAQLAAAIGKPPVDDEAAKPHLYRQPFNVSSVGDNIIISGRQGYQIAIHELMLYNTAVQTIRLLDGANDLIGPLVNLPDSAGFSWQYHDQPRFLLDHGSDFKLNLAVGQVTGYVTYRYQGVS